MNVKALLPFKAFARITWHLSFEYVYSTFVKRPSAKVCTHTNERVGRAGNGEKMSRSAQKESK